MEYRKSPADGNSAGQGPHGKKSILCFDRWCALAVSGIRFKPDRKAVYEELYAHMEDQYEELTAEGVSEKEAEEEVAEAMGDPGETAQQLARIHRPFWGCALLAARICLIVSAILALLILPRYIRGLGIGASKADEFFGEDRETAWSYNRRIYYTEPGARDRADGYTFTVTRVAERSIGSKSGPDDARGLLYLEVKVTNPRPWAAACTAYLELSAVDSLGYVYNSTWYTDQTPYLTADLTRTGLFTDTWVVILRDYRSQAANWIELRYDKSGRHLRLTVDLRDRKEAAA